MHRLEHAAHPGEYLVEVFHWMIYIPSWLAKWKREGLEWHRKDTEMFYALYESAKERVVCLIPFVCPPCAQMNINNNALQKSGLAKPCLTSILMRKSELTEKEAAWIAGSMLYVATLFTHFGVFISFYSGAGSSTVRWVLL